MKKTLRSGVLISITLGVLAGIILYNIVVNRMHSKYESNIESAMAFSGSIQQDPAFSGVIVDSSRISQFEDHKIQIWRLLANMNIIEWDDGIGEVGGLIENGFKKTFQNGTINLYKEKGVSFLTSFSKNIGNDTLNSSFNEEELIAHVVSCLAEKEEAFVSYDRYISASNSVTVSQLKGLNSGDTKTDLLNRLFLHFEIGSKFDNLPIELEGATIENSDEYKQIKELMQNVILNIMEDPEVVAAKDWLVIYKGPEQFLMIIIFFCALFLLIQKTLNDRKLFFESTTRMIKFREKSLKWLFTTIPAIGFIGTIRGLGLALGDADSIVRAGNQVQSSVAIGDVTNMLKIAFTTTLVALVLVIVLELIKLLLSYLNNLDVE